MGREPRESAALQRLNQVEAHGKGSVGLAAAATGKGIDTVLRGTTARFHQPGR